MTRRSPGPGLASRNRVRPAVETLEDRLVLNAGDLDPTFGVGGLVQTDMHWNGRLFALAAQPDGKVVAGGSSFRDGHSLALTRYDLAGNLDPTFGIDGKVFDNIHSTKQGTIRALGLQSTGAIVATGHGEFADGDFVLVRYDTNGNLDTTFGDDGEVTVDLDPHGVSCFDLALLPDDRIVVVGALSVEQGATKRIFVARYLPDGAPDPTFGGQGYVTTDTDVPGAYPTTVHVYEDGRILVGGPASYLNNFYDLVLARYLEDGTPDSDFGEAGLVKTQIHDLNADVRDLTVLPDGAILAVGAIWGNGINTDIAIFRYLPGGELDSDFGANGLLRIDFSNTTEAAETIVDLGDGKYILAGHFSGDGLSQAFVGRLTADMQPDPLFGNEGWVFTNFTLNDSGGINDFVMTPDGRLIAGGNSSNDFLLAAYQNFPEASLPPEETFARAASGNEGAKVQLRVELSRPTIRKAKVGYTVIGGTARRDRDYVLADGQVKFEPGQTQQFTKLKILDDQRPEPDETIILKLKNPRFASLATASVLTYTIVDNDSTARSAAESQRTEASPGGVETLLLNDPIRTKNGTAPLGEVRRPEPASRSNLRDVLSAASVVPSIPENRPITRRRPSQATLDTLATELVTRLV